jgi:hypothetical protein
MTASLFAQSEQLVAASRHWCFAKDGDPHAYELARRHYSARRYRRQRQRQFVGPGRKLVLLSSDGLAVFAWRDFIDDTQPAQTGWNCSIFRNEGLVLSSALIREAVTVVFDQWGRARCYTLVDPKRIRSTHPGFCFKMAGWTECGVSKNGKTILELI